MKKKFFNIILSLAMVIMMMPAMTMTVFAGAEMDQSTVVMLKAGASGSRAVKLSWTKADSATKYVVYGQKCGKKYKKLKTTTGTSYKVKKIRGKKLKAHKTYKFYVVAYKGSSKLAKSKSIHFITGKTQGKYANAESISVKPTSLTLEPGNTATLKATTKIYKNRKHIKKSHGIATRYVSSCPAVAKVSSKGVVTAVAEGTAIIYIQDIGGLWTKTAVTVNKPEPPAPEEYTVSFDMQGHGTQIDPIADVVSGSKISAPTAPTDPDYDFGGWYKEAECTNEWNFDTDTVTANTTLYAKWDAKGCLAAGTLITMANGTKQAVETLELGDAVKTFDHETGEISTAPICAVWGIEECYGNFTLHFTDGIVVSVVQEHCFFDRDSNRYEFISYQNASEYVGHYFYNADEGKWEELLSVDFSEEPVTAYYIFTGKHFNHVAEGMLSLDPLDDGFMTYVFDFGENLKFDEAKMLTDIRKYGLMTLEEMPYVPEDYFDILNMQYLKVAYGKGLADPKTVEEMIRYYISQYI